ncbi:MAG TPA: TetR/AcrR family transcriptional regulator, partial [Gammaproteobacteria bacterium]|nr:TetR/AcrR family transcriptional regulator [Gammaproteobacteria bacterium]
EIVDEDHPARAVIKQHKLDIAQRLRDLCRQMGAKQPDLLGDALSLLYSGAFSARLAFDNREQMGALSAAASALLDSALGAPAQR